ncbi:hypothetical protein [Flagellimonas sp. 2504JD1-5]
MKYILYNATILIFFLFSGALSMAQESGAHPLVGTWAFDQAASFEKMLPEDKQFLDSDPRAKAEILTSYAGRVLMFGPDGSFIQNDPSGRRVNGTWALQGQNLVIQGMNGSQWVQQVAYLDSYRLVLKQIAKGEAKPLLPEIHLTKNQ